jgi:hypothetical protein
MVPESQNTEALRSQPVGSLAIILFGIGFVVLPSVQFNNQFAIEASEVDNEMPNGCLPTKFEFLELLAAQEVP